MLNKENSLIVGYTRQFVVILGFLTETLFTYRERVVQRRKPVTSSLS
jgi:hypothetical protein